MDSNLVFLVPRNYVKRVKTALEEHGGLDKKNKITGAAGEQHDRPGVPPLMRIPTTIPFMYSTEAGENYCSEGTITTELKVTILGSLHLPDLQGDIDIILSRPPETPVNEKSYQKNPLVKALAAVLSDLPEPTLSTLDLSSADLVDAFPTTYSIYKPMLLLPSHTLSSQPWKTLLAAHPASSEILTPVWRHIAASVGCTHVALNSGIPPSTTTTPSSASQEENVLRAPLNITPLHGSFGPPPTDQLKTNPTQKDFEEAFWVETTQNGIKQVWAPMYTMFSRGNVKEKARVMYLDSVKTAIADTNTIGREEGSGNTNGRGCTAVDLYAGIGYFTFSYRAAGVRRVLCWELNPWSIEGLRRGADRNGWKTKILPSRIEDWNERDVAPEILAEYDFLVFPTSNEHAESMLRRLQTSKPTCGRREAFLGSVRHVNLGFLPTSQGAWRTAVRVLDREMGGWLHVHENVGVEEVEKKKDVVVEAMKEFVAELDGEEGYGGKGRRAECEHVERVKTYAPGVLHVVFDVWVQGRKEGSKGKKAA